MISLQTPPMLLTILNKSGYTHEETSTIIKYCIELMIESAIVLRDDRDDIFGGDNIYLYRLTNILNEELGDIQESISQYTPHLLDALASNNITNPYLVKSTEHTFIISNKSEYS